ncbi:hypothetical protein KKF04_05790, partial [Patescibacteria group bacterium]|nr:hypothetical protein [Patescibacteria group bacterium]
MKKHIKLISAGILLVILLIGGYIYFSQQKPTSEEYAAHPECYDSGGVWATFPDTSADHCFSPGRGLLVTYGCDCGPSKCWDSEKCVKNESYQFEEVIACTNSGGMFKNGKCECPSETY